jgi:uncharacterized RDD family membrane protein YckC
MQGELAALTPCGSKQHMAISPLRNILDFNTMNKFICPKCSTEFENKTKFCPNCGCNTAEYHAVCPQCHKAYPAGTKFCADDGTLIPEGNRYVQSHVSAGKKAGKNIVDATDTILSSALGENENKTIYPKAPFGKRLAAYLLDGLICIILCIPAYIAIIKAFQQSSLPSLIGIIGAPMLWLAIPLIYSFIKDGLGKGQSWGKRACGLMVVHLPSNDACSKGKSCLRRLVRTCLGFTGFGWLIEFIMVLVDKGGRSLADCAANTQVIEASHYEVNDDKEDIEEDIEDDDKLEKVILAIIVIVIVIAIVFFK